MKKDLSYYKTFKFINPSYVKLFLLTWFVEGGRSVPPTCNLIYDI